MNSSETTGKMSGLVIATYRIALANIKNLSTRDMWVGHEMISSPESFKSVDTNYYKIIYKETRPGIFVIPYQLFIEDEGIC